MTTRKRHQKITNAKDGEIKWHPKKPNKEKNNNLKGIEVLTTKLDFEQQCSSSCFSGHIERERRNEILAHSVTKIVLKKKIIKRFCK